MKDIGSDWPEPYVGECHIRIYYEDTDFTGYVFHANYLKYFDRAREDLLGFATLQRLYELGKHFVVRKAELDFHHPAGHGDTLVVKTKVRCSLSPLIYFRQEAYLQNGETLQAIVTGQIELVTVNERGSPTRTPREIVAHFQELADNKLGN